VNERTGASVETEASLEQKTAIGAAEEKSVNGRQLKSWDPGTVDRFQTATSGDRSPIDANPDMQSTARESRECVRIRMGC
jgi:hypothetical protein